MEVISQLCTRRGRNRVKAAQKGGTAQGAARRERQQLGGNRVSSGAKGGTAQREARHEGQRKGRGSAKATRMQVRSGASEGV